MKKVNRKQKGGVYSTHDSCREIRFGNESVIDGPCTVFYDDGHKKSVTNYEYGVKQGAYTKWDQQGNMIVLGYYKNGKRDGLWVEFDPSSDSSVTIVYKNGTKM